MKQKKLIFVIIISFLFIFDNPMVVKGATDCNKYACATCSYYEENTDTLFNYTLKSDGAGSLNMEFKIDTDMSDVRKVKNNIPSSFFINTETNKIECFPIYYVNYDGLYTDSNGKTKLQYNANTSSNNNKDVSIKKENNYKCTFTDSKSNVSCTIGQVDGKVSSSTIDCGTFPFVASKSDINFLNGADFSNCSKLNVNIYCGYEYDGGCYIFDSKNVPEWIGTIPNNGENTTGNDGTGTTTNTEQNTNTTNNNSSYIDNWETTELNLCQDPDFIRILMLVKTVVSLIMIGTAVVLIIMGMISIAKAVTDEKGDLEKPLKKFKNQIILAVIVLLLPTLINWIFFTDNFITDKSPVLSECINNMNEEKIQELEAQINKN